jgi:hypothetical protein
MISKISAVLAAAMMLGSASIASAATGHKVPRHHQVQRGTIRLLENIPARAPGAGTAAVKNFQDNWNVSY